MQLTEQQFKMGDMTITKEYRHGIFFNFWVQNKDGAVIFDGTTKEASDLLDALKAVLYEEVL